MYRIVYTSRACDGFSSQDFASLAARSARSNEKRGISGLLLFDGSRFLQALEGAEDIVKDCYARIAADPRHLNVVTLQDCETDERQFGDWSLRGLDLLDCKQDFLKEVSRDIALVDSAELQAWFIGFAALSNGVRRQGMTLRG